MWITIEFPLVIYRMECTSSYFFLNPEYVPSVYSKFNSDGKVNVLIAFYNEFWYKDTAVFTGAIKGKISIRKWAFIFEGMLGLVSFKRLPATNLLRKVESRK